MKIDLKVLHEAVSLLTEMIDELEHQGEAEEESEMYIYLCEARSMLRQIIGWANGRHH